MNFWMPEAGRLTSASTVADWIGPRLVCCSRLPPVAAWAVLTTLMLLMANSADQPRVRTRLCSFAATSHLIVAKSSQLKPHSCKEACKCQAE